MAQTVQIKKSATALDAPATLLDGELAVNTTDEKLYVGNGTSVVELLKRGQTSVSGILKGNGSVISAAVSGTDIKTVNGSSILGSGNLVVSSSTPTQTFNVTFVSEDTTQAVTIADAAITASSKIAVYIDGEEAAILEMAGRLLSADTGTADIICHAPNGATGTYSGYISIS